MSSAVRLAVIIIGIAAIIGGVYGGYQNYERDQRAAEREQHALLIHGKQEALQSRINALRTEMQTPTTDPAEIKSRQERLSGLQKDLDSLKKDVGSP